LSFHFTLYFSYPRRRENVYYGFTALFCLLALMSLHISEIYCHDDRIWSIAYRYGFLAFTPLSLISGLGLFQLVFTGRVIWTFHAYAVLGMAAFLTSLKYGHDPVHWYPVLMLPELARVVWVTRARRRVRVAWFIAGLAVMAATVLNALGSVYEWPETSGFLRYAPWYSFVVFLQGVLLAFAREFARDKMQIERFAASLGEQVAERTRELEDEISVRKKAEADLSNSLALLRATIESAANAILVVDLRQDVVLYNRTLETMWGIPEGWATRMTASERNAFFVEQALAPNGAAVALAQLLAVTEENTTTTVALKDERVIECLASPYRVDGETVGRLLTFLDVTERANHEHMLENLVDQLQQALSEVRTLSGLLPICANCKRIRDDKGYWNQIEEYIHRHSGAMFTHGICPDCASKMYADLVAKDK